MLTDEESFKNYSFSKMAKRKNGKYTIIWWLLILTKQYSFSKKNDFIDFILFLLINTYLNTYLLKKLVMWKVHNLDYSK